MRPGAFAVVGALGAALAVGSFSGPAVAESSRMYGAEAPFGVGELPPGQLRSALESLPAEARSRALNWLHSFSFPEQDLVFLRADAEGAIYYVDEGHTVALAPEQAGTAEPAGAAGVPACDPNAVFQLHSNPGAPSTLFLDFDGHVMQDTAWNSNLANPLVAAAFDLDNSPATFNTDEACRIAEIWHRVAEDMAPFDVDVTTEEPASFGPQVGRVLITRDADVYGNPMPAQGAGGVAYVGVFGASYYAYYSPALVYYDNLGNGHAGFVAEAASHEFGHNLNLSHDGSSGSAYYSGHGSNYTSWAPIMGVGYSRHVTQWSRGEYSGASNTQDDLAIIEARLGYLADDHGDELSSATPLLVSADGSLVSSNPETDAFNELPANKGVIGYNLDGAGWPVKDFDTFYMDVGAGPLSLTVTPAWDAFYRESYRGANLDVEAVLLDGAGTTLAFSEPQNETDAVISATVPAGRYYLRVNGIGSALSPYSDYASLGQYFIAGSVTPPGAGSNQPPVVSFASSCNGLDCAFLDSSSDSDGSLASWTWNFGDGAGSTLQNPQHRFAAAGTYPVTLTVVDNEGADSSLTRSITVSDPSAVAPGVPADLGAVDNGSGAVALSWSAEPVAAGYDVRSERQHPKNGRWVDSQLLATGVTATSLVDSTGNGTFRYSVRASNAYGSSDWSAWVTVTVSSEVSGGGGGDGGGGGKCHPKRGC